MNPTAIEALESVRKMRQTMSKMEKRKYIYSVLFPVIELLCEDLANRSGSAPDLLTQLREALDRAAPSQLAEELIEITEDECSADLDSSEDELSDVEESNGTLLSEPVQVVGPPAEEALIAQQLVLEAQQAELAAVKEPQPEQQEQSLAKKKAARAVKVERVGDWTVAEADPDKVAKARAKQLKKDRKEAKKKAKALGDATLRRRASSILTPHVEPSDRSTVTPGTAAALRRATSPQFDITLVLKE